MKLIQRIKLYLRRRMGKLKRFVQKIAPHSIVIVTSITENPLYTGAKKSYETFSKFRKYSTRFLFFGAFLLTLFSYMYSHFFPNEKDVEYDNPDISENAPFYSRFLITMFPSFLQALSELMQCTNDYGIVNEDALSEAFNTLLSRYLLLRVFYLQHIRIVWSRFTEERTNDNISTDYDPNDSLYHIF